jgi:hypothetical protein
MVQADTIYRSVDEKGVVEFSDQGKKGAEEIKVDKVPTYKFKKLPRSATKTSKAVAEKTRQIEIVSPSMEETIRDNQGNLTVKLSLRQITDGQAPASGSEAKAPTPAAADDKASQDQQSSGPQPVDNLNEGEKIVIMLDDKVLLETDQAMVELHNIDRGTHHLKAVVVDQQGTPLFESQVIEFYMKRFSKLFKKPVNPVNPVKPANPPTTN